MKHKLRVGQTVTLRPVATDRYFRGFDGVSFLVTDQVMDGYHGIATPKELGSSAVQGPCWCPFSVAHAGLSRFRGDVHTETLL